MALTCDFRYLISIPYGILRLAAIIVAILVMICIGSFANVEPSVNGLVWWTISGSAITTAVFLIFYVIHFPQTFPRIPWSIAEFAVGVFWIAFYIMSFIACCAKSSQWSNWTPANVHPGYGAAAFFCLVNIILFGALCFLLFRLWRSGTTIQTSSTITTTTTSVKY